ncbi:hypothetical protein Q4488_15490 [Amphritea sp. 1_MG-2023]|uniref:capsular polysaccharide export protein, LipB/KpsS family n=1 Tax=Amphritea sp. 1_MG-2023 TaxID=3062670 RepID=UPI0026E25C61|nr:hypothetical protein [Amphritea sp. 1_MG-2023]MDO6564787.1 hypothetical protein [Amphritea sp. 1_MG-2023]
MTTAFFASRRIHKDYFSKLATYLDSSRVINYKECVIPALTSIPFKSINAAVHILISEKKNHSKYRFKNTTFWFFFNALKSTESYWLYLCYYKALANRNINKIILWNGLKHRQSIVSIAAKNLGIQCIYMENGLLPGHTTIDPHGINYLNSVPREKSFYQTYSDGKFNYKELITFNPSTLKKQKLPEKYIFIPLQVNTDSQIIRFSPWIKDMYDFIEIINKASLELDKESPIFIFKTHPACSQNYSKSIESSKKSKKLLLLDDDKLTTAELIYHATAVITINSTVGIESLLQNKTVISLGQAFYNIDGLTLTCNTQKQLINAIRNSYKWHPDPLIISNFFEYLVKEYQLPGRWQDSSSEHLKNVIKRIQEIS